jgi:hypothetical protein
MVGTLHGALDYMIPLFSAVVQAYDNEFAIVKQMIRAEIAKIEEFLVEDIDAVRKRKKLPVPAISFDEVLAHIQLVQRKLDSIIANVEDIEGRKKNIAEMGNAISPIINALLTHPDVPERMAAYMRRWEEMKKKSSKPSRA